MKIFFFKLKTKRIHYPGKGGCYGEARLYYPMATEDNADFFERVRDAVSRRDDKDVSWEQRVLSFAVDYLEEQGLFFHCFADATPYPNVAEERTWIIATEPSILAKSSY